MQLSLLSTIVLVLTTSFTKFASASPISESSVSVPAINETYTGLVNVANGQWTPIEQPSGLEYVLPITHKLPNLPSPPADSISTLENAPPHSPPTPTVIPAEVAHLTHGPTLAPAASSTGRTGNGSQCYHIGSARRGVG